MLHGLWTGSTYNRVVVRVLKWSGCKIEKGYCFVVD